MLNDWNIVDHHILETEHDETQSRPDPSRRKQPTNKTQGQREKESKQQVEKQLDCTSQLDLSQRSGSLTHVNIQPSILIKLVGCSYFCCRCCCCCYWRMGTRITATLPHSFSRFKTWNRNNAGRFQVAFTLIADSLGNRQKTLSEKEECAQPLPKREKNKNEKEEQPFNVKQSRTSFLYSVCVFVLSFLTVEIA